MCLIGSVGGTVFDLNEGSFNETDLVVRLVVRMRLRGDELDHIIVLRYEDSLVRSC